MKNKFSPLFLAAALLGPSAFAAEKIEGKPLYLNLTNNQDCLINE